MFQLTSIFVVPLDYDTSFRVVPPYVPIRRDVTPGLQLRLTLPRLITRGALPPLPHRVQKPLHTIYLFQYVHILVPP